MSTTNREGWGGRVMGRVGSGQALHGSGRVGSDNWLLKSGRVGSRPWWVGSGRVRKIGPGNNSAVPNFLDWEVSQSVFNLVAMMAFARSASSGPIPDFSLYA